jgi:2-polyprenyl-6-methoxyphenol hydroxylase-like FAD-dependent oxidoreductase
MRTKIRHIVVQGAGVAGLATSLRLGGLRGVEKITVLEKSKRETCEHVTGHTGLWTNALNVLKAIGAESPTSSSPAAAASSFSSLTNGENCGFVQDSGYKNMKGDWLMKPSVGVSTYDGRVPSLGFVSNQSLLSFMRARVQQLHPSIEIDMRYEEGVESIKSSPSYGDGDSGCVITTSTGMEIPCDLLVAADGMDSHLLSMIVDNNNSLQGGSGGGNIEPIFNNEGKNVVVGAEVADRGYNVFRGYISKKDAFSKLPQAALSSSFQSWGPGLRFAVVPASHGGFTWFAAVSQPPPSGSRHNSSSSSSSSSSSTGYSEMGRAVERAGPFSNQSWIASSEELLNLKSTFSDWHAPVADIVNLAMMNSSSSSNSNHSSLNNGNGNGVQGDGKKKTKTKKSKGKTAGPHPNINDTGVVSVCRGVGSVSTPRGVNSVFTLQRGGGSVAVACVGDAFFTFDPILAVGGGQAIVAADLLASSLAKHLEKEGEDGGEGTGAGEKEWWVMRALREYEGEYSKRCVALGVVSDIAQKAGALQSPVLNAYRDVVLTWVVPDGAKGRAMDSLIRVTAGVK